jgi:uncharacterized protein YkwD
MTRRLLFACGLILTLSLTVSQADEKAKVKNSKLPAKVKMKADEKQLFDLLNAARAKEKLPALVPNPVLFKLARDHSANMAKQKKMAHELDGKKVKDRAKAASYDYRYIGENVAWSEDQPEMKEIHEGWMKSKGHRENILKEPYREVGLGIAKSSKGEYYFTQVFGVLRKKVADD